MYEADIVAVRFRANAQRVAVLRFGIYLAEEMAGIYAERIPSSWCKDWFR